MLAYFQVCRLGSLPHMERFFQWIGYVASALLLRYLAFPSGVVAVWGAGVFSRISPAAIGFPALILAGFLSLLAPKKARVIAFFGVGVLTLMWFPSILNLVSEPARLLAWRNWFLIGGYFSAMAFVLLYPHPFHSLSKPILALLVGISLLSAGHHTMSRFVDYCRAEAKADVKVKVSAQGEVLPPVGEK